MSPAEPVTLLIQRLKAGDKDAIEQLWKRYFERLVRLARRRLGGNRSPVADEEDVALSAFDSVCRRSREGRFRRLVTRNDLWQILAIVTRRKAINQRKKEACQKRLHGTEAPGEGAASRQPDPPTAVQIAEECRRLLEKLNDLQLQQIAVAKMEGYSNEEIARIIERSVATVERKLKLIRSIWQDEVGS
jgi:DNA-directed RNA polymerase specialized sigma24 family protein